MRLLLLGLLAGCSLSVDYTGTYFACGEGDTCAPGFVCLNDVCVPQEPEGPECSKSMAAGGLHGCSVRSDDGTVWCWGRNNVGQLGGNQGADAVLPVQVTGITNATEVGTGDEFSCAIVGGGVKCWGDNNVGQLGNGVSAPSNDPVDVIGLTGVTALAIGDAHACALAGGVVSCWGSNDAGQLGDGTTAVKRAPVAVPGIVNATAIAVSDDSSCAVDGGTLKCWGDNSEGSFMTGNTMPSPTPVASVMGIAGVAVGPTHLCVFDTGGLVTCAGSNEEGQLGDGTVTPNTSPVAAVIPAKVVGLSLSFRRSCAVDDQHRAWCWGDDDARLGLGFATDVVTTPTLTEFKDVASMSLNADRVCARSIAGSISCTGTNAFGQLGTGVRTTQPHPQEVPDLDNIVAVASGNDFTCALDTAGDVFCWGEGTDGQLGDGGRVTRARPVKALVSSVKKIVAGDDAMCAIGTNGSVSCWGQGDSGQLGVGLTTRGIPITMTGILDPDDLVMGNDHTCARIGAQIKCWGSDGSAQFGDGLQQTGGTTITPASMFTGSASSATAGGAFTCVIDETKQAQCWGQNFLGQHANGSTGITLTPTKASNQTGIITGIDEIGARGNNTFFRVGGTVFGAGAQNMLIKFGSESSSEPTAIQLQDVTNAATLSIGFSVGCLTRTDGGVMCWGPNDQGQVGDGSYGSTTPTTIPGLMNLLGIAAGDEHVCAVTAEHKVVCWGSDTDGELGDGVLQDLGPSFVRLQCQ